MGLFIIGCTSGTKIISDNKLQQGLSKNQFGTKFFMASPKHYIYIPVLSFEDEFAKLKLNQF